MTLKTGVFKDSLCRNFNSVINYSKAWYCRECASKTSTEEKKFLKKGTIFVYFVHKKYSHSFVTLWLNPWFYMDYMMSLLPFWALNVVVTLLSMQGQRAPWFHQKYLHLCSEDEWRSYGFGMTWGSVINDYNGWTIPLSIRRYLNII